MQPASQARPVARVGSGGGGLQLARCENRRHGVEALGSESAIASVGSGWWRRRGTWQSETSMPPSWCATTTSSCLKMPVPAVTSSQVQMSTHKLQKCVKATIARSKLLHFSYFVQPRVCDIQGFSDTVSLQELCSPATWMIWVMTGTVFLSQSTTTPYVGQNLFNVPSSNFSNTVEMVNDWHTATISSARRPVLYHVILDLRETTQLWGHSQTCPFNLP